MIAYATMLGLFLAVLTERSLDITALEILFWFWSAGYMLDEIVGFTEQGFGLYIMSFWNVFDIGILLLFVVYYVLRLYGIIMPDVQKSSIANMAYDVLASTAVLLFPRLFSVLDHYRYFSQLLIAFRMMAIDLVAVLILIVISCSGFFVAFTMSFSTNGTSASDAAYALFQLVMGFTPAAWDRWKDYNTLGKALMTVFLIICHFLIVTILITVLTNSFMAIVQNANEEHQFVFAVNTISMVKSDALFSYIPPTNILAWLLAPLRYVMPFPRFVKLNRTIIKVTHFPVLFLIFAYERVILARHAYEPAELVEQRGRAPSRMPAFTIRGPDDLFSPTARLREPSVTTFHKDRALEEVFRRPFRSPNDAGLGRRDSAYERNKSSNVVQDWMRGVGREGGAGSPVEQSRSVVERLEHRRPLFRRLKTSQAVSSRRRDWATPPRPSSMPLEEMVLVTPASQRSAQRDYGFPNMSMDHLPQQTDADGDDELATNDEDDRRTYDQSFLDPDNSSDKENRRVSRDYESEEDFHKTPTAGKLPLFRPSDSLASRPIPESPERPITQHRIAPKREKMHVRNSSSATILFSPIKPPEDNSLPYSPRSVSPVRRPSKSKQGSGGVGATTSGTATPRKTAKRIQPIPPPARPRPVDILRDQHYSSPNLAGFLALDRRKPSFNAMALDLASDLGDNRYPVDANIIGAMPASFGTQLEMAAYHRHQQRRRRDDDDDDDDNNGDGVARRETTTKMNRIMIERMTTLEAGFREVLREVKRVSRAGSVEDEPSSRGNKKGKKKAISKSGPSSRMHSDNERVKKGKENVDQGWIDEEDETHVTRSSV
jgi:Ion transport protein